MPVVSKCDRTNTCPELIDHDGRCPLFDAEFWSKIKVTLTPGEEIITNRFGQADRFRS